ncbi:Cytochrome c551/c552 [Acidisarcina polymorpha]|uniref:Cytochrome c551/c552 n=1 Tax=Acidisarcina polymorpha TaxID=2211140 RepID=A0A2Z5FY28_9BACT|nr:ThuA domain-containing protein [Acidisarcina polymorpha]AXC11712.1 Cytochrome c551/c552 [Acidisarcina polymorpha]
MSKTPALRFQILIAVFFAAAMTAFAQDKPFQVLAFYSTNVEQDHVDFAMQALKFYAQAAERDHFTFRSTSNWNDLNPEVLKQYQVVVWLDDFPSEPAQREAFQAYMEHGGAWLGFHISGYIDRRETWPWFADFLGAVFYGNSWPPLPATLDIDDPASPVTKGLPSHYLSPANEWYSWKPDPRQTPYIKVLMTLDPSNYPLGFKDTLTGGDIPVTWTNTKYKMIYTNIGHGNKIFTEPLQNSFIENILLRLGGRG